MTTKSESVNARIDWDLIDKVTEVRRTYLVTDRNGRQFYKMYKPSEADSILKAQGCTGKIVSILDRSRIRRKS